MAKYKQVLDISNLPIGFRKEILDFYDFLVHKMEKQSSSQQKNQSEIESLFGKYRHIETSSELFAESKKYEKNIEL